jgi:hypothetical protein
VLPPQCIDSRSGVPAQREERFAQAPGLLDMMPQSSKRFLPILACSLPYAFQRTGQGVPALCPVPVLLDRIPPSRPLSLHLLRRPRPGCALVRGLPRYNGPVRPPGLVHHWRAPWGFPVRTTAPSFAGGRFQALPAPARGVSVRARGLGPRRVGGRLALAAPLVLPSATNDGVGTRKISGFSGLNTRPARAPVNAASAPYGGRRMTRGRSGSLLLLRMALSSTTPRRFVWAHRSRRSRCAAVGPA